MDDGRRSDDNKPAPPNEYPRGAEQARLFHQRVQAAGGIKAWRSRHNDGGKAKGDR